MLFRCCLLGLLLALPLAAGCSGDNLGQVAGTVTLDGKSLSKGTITFETTGKRPATARIENGQIVDATTFKPGDGVPVGTHKVAITANEDGASAEVSDPGKGKGPGANYMVGKSLIPSAYNDPTTSKLTADVKSGKNTLEFKLSSKGP